MGGKKGWEKAGRGGKKGGGITGESGRQKRRGGNKMEEERRG